MGGDGKANMLCSWPSPIWLCQKMEKNNLKWVKLFLFLFRLARPLPGCWRAWACCVTALCRLRGSPVRLGAVCACLWLALAGAVWPWVVQRSVLISAPPPLTVMCKKPVKMNIWQRNHPDFRRKCPGFMISHFCSSINSRLAGESVFCCYSRGRVGRGEPPRWGCFLGRKNILHQLSGLLACQDAVVFYPDSVLWKDSGCDCWLGALVLLITN